MGQSPAASPTQTPLMLAVEPIYGAAKTKERYQPLADYLSLSIERKVRIVTLPNFFAYWGSIRRADSYDLVLDAAHFTDYRIQKHNYQALVKLPGYTSHSLIIHKQGGVTHPLELVSKRIATLGTPSMGAMRLMALFPNPVRQPTIVDVDDLDEALQQLLQQRVDAAILPIPFIALNLEQLEQLEVVMSTEPLPNLALSAAPTVDAKTRDIIRETLIAAASTKKGKRMLEKIRVEAFVAADAEMYRGQSDTLKKYWGY